MFERKQKYCNSIFDCEIYANYFINCDDQHKDLRSDLLRSRKSDCIRHYQHVKCVHYKECRLLNFRINNYCNYNLHTGIEGVMDFMAFSHLNRMKSIDWYWYVQIEQIHCHVTNGYFGRFHKLNKLCQRHKHRMDSIYTKKSIMLSQVHVNWYAMRCSFVFKEKFIIKKKQCFDVKKRVLNVT